MKISAKKIAVTALLAALSMLLGIVESLLPPIIPALPFVRIGYRFGKRRNRLCRNSFGHSLCVDGLFDKKRNRSVDSRKSRNGDLFAGGRADLCGRDGGFDKRGQAVATGDRHNFFYRA